MSQVPSNIQFASFYRRLVAYVLDNIFTTFISVFLLQTFWAEEMQQWAELYITSAKTGEVVALPGAMLIVHISCFAIYSAFFWLRYQGTPAQRILKMRVLNVETGGALNINQVSLRFAVLYGISIIAGPLAPIILAWSMFRNQQQRALHDLVASSVVVMQTVETEQNSALEPEAGDHREF
jgi:uncharacterized RDD family membrane protein YckC